MIVARDWSECCHGLEVVLPGIEGSVARDGVIVARDWSECYHGL